MTADLPDPLVAPDVDVRDLDGFMLNVERLMASELVALSSHEVIAAALFLWCRAWKQLPAASLPDDDRVIAAFSRLPQPRFRRLKVEILRGFVKCSDGRLYHRVLADEATGAFARKNAFRNRRERDAERLRAWRDKQGRNTNETDVETQQETTPETVDETRFVREGQGQGRDRDLKKKDAAPPLRDGIGLPRKPPDDLRRQLYARGADLLGSNSGAIVSKLLTSTSQDVAEARAILEKSAGASPPKSYLMAAIHKRGNGSSRDLGGARSSRDM